MKLMRQNLEHDKNVQIQRHVQKAFEKWGTRIQVNSYLNVNKNSCKTDGNEDGFDIQMHCLFF